MVIERRCYMDKLIAVVDDEEDIRELVSICLKRVGYKVKEYENADSLLKAMPKSLPDLIVLDLMMPGTDGIEACKILKRDNRYAKIPVIMLTARAEETDKIVGLEIGADDYITKPFSPKELAARVKAVLRRGDIRKEETNLVKIGDITMDAEKHEVMVKNKKTELTATEYRILEILASKQERVFSREQLLDNLWGNEKTVVDRTVDVHIKHLREKLGSSGKMIKNIRGVGYKIEL
jgi:two-component system phosphate regulon response regulator PhoB/two-component system alkaline phosphatase synthesis response regulator PhoP